MSPQHFPTTGNGGQQPPNTGPVCKARLDKLPTKLAGPAQQKSRSPEPLLLPGVSARLAAPLPAATADHPPAAAEEEPPAPAQPKITRPLAPEEPAQQTRAAVPFPAAAPAVAAPALSLDLPTPTPHTVPFASLPPSQSWRRRHQRLLLSGIGAGSLVVVLVIVLLVVVILPAVTLVATVTLVPQSAHLSTTLTITAITTGTPDLGKQEVTARLLSVQSPIQGQTVPTTGTGHASARAAQGVLTFYNAAPYQQTVPPGTILAGADGVEIVTDAPAVIPASHPPIEGEVSAPAHAVLSGPQGNIAPLDLNGLCCMAGVSVTNGTAFHGGQDAYDYPAVTQQDIEQVAAPLITPLTQQTQASLQAQVHPHEYLVGLVQCQPTISPNHPVGSEAVQVRVTVSVACHAEVYDHKAVVQVVTNALMHEARTMLGSGYSLAGTISTTITQAVVPHTKPGTLTLLVTGQGVWVHQVSAAEQARLRRLIAGLSRQQAIHVLQQQEHDHLAGIHIQITGVWADGNRLPADPARVQLVVMVEK